MNRFANKLCLGLFLTLIYVSELLAQAASMQSVFGYVVDAENSEPLPGVNVFLAYSTKGDATNKEGYFEIPKVATGAYDLIVSMIGYDVEKRKMHINDAFNDTLFFELKRKVFRAPEIKVTAAKIKDWKKNFKKFKKFIFSTTLNADECKILNPFVLDFPREKRGVFTAVAQEPLIIENRALGYKLHYILEKLEATFTSIKYAGVPRFVEMTSTSTREKEKWRNFPDYWEVAFTMEEADEGYFLSNPDVKFGDQRSWITLDTGPTLIDTKGHRYEEFGMTIVGYWGWERIAELLPWDYDPDIVKSSLSQTLQKK
ncbi:MAG: carboxypeptidase-like regulatory domain-containing protein [bacterium]